MDDVFRRCRCDGSVHGGVAERQRACRIEAHVHDRVHRREVPPDDRVTAVGEELLQHLLGLQVVELSHARHRGKHLVGEMMYPAGRPELVVQPRRPERRIRVPRLPLLGIPARVIDRERADRARAVHRDRPPVLDVEAERGDPHQGLLAFDEVLPAFERLAGIHAGAAHGRPEVEQVVPDDAPAVLLDDRVERVDRLGIDVVHPRRERAVRAQFAAVLVREHVVGIVRTGAVEPEPADGPAVERLAGDDAIGPVGIAVCLAQQRADVRRLHPAAIAAGRRDARTLVYRQPIGSKRGKVHLRHVIAEGPEQLGDHHLGPCRHRAITGRIELDEPDLPGCVANRETRRDAVVLGRDHGPVPRCRAVDGVGALQQVVHADRVHAYAVREPVRVGYLVHRVDVLRPDVRRPVARPVERVLERVVDQIDLALRHTRGILRVDHAHDRIVRVERGARRRGSEACGEGERRDDVARTLRTAPARCSFDGHQNAPPALMSSRAACSRLCAASIRNT